MLPSARSPHPPKRNGDLQPAQTKISRDTGTMSREIIKVDALECCGNRRPQVERLVSVWNQGLGGHAKADCKVDDPLIGASAEPKQLPRTRLTDEEEDAMRTARAQGVRVNALSAPVQYASWYGVAEDTMTSFGRQTSSRPVCALMGGLRGQRGCLCWSQSSHVARGRFSQSG